MTPVSSKQNQITQRNCNQNMIKVMRMYLTVAMTANGHEFYLNEEKRYLQPELT